MRVQSEVSGRKLVFFFWPHPRDMEVLRLGVDLVQAYTGATATRDLSRVCNFWLTAMPET